jgi:hypothetical protein
MDRADCVPVQRSTEFLEITFCAPRFGVCLNKADTDLNA